MSNKPDNKPVKPVENKTREAPKQPSPPQKKFGEPVVFAMDEAIKNKK